MAQFREKKYEIDMTRGAILPKLLQFALPLMLSSMLQLLFNAADVVVVGRFAGDNALAAVGSNSALVNLLVNLFVGLSVGASILASRYYGAGEKEALRQTVHTAMMTGLLGGILLAVIGFLSAETLLTWMQSPEEVRRLAAIYLRIYFLGMPANLLYNYGAALLRAVGDTRRPLYYLTFAGIVNVTLNLFFVIVCEWSVAGVAIATVISQCLSAFLVLRCMIRDTGSMHLELRQLRIYSARLKQILLVGVPAGINGILFSLSNVVIQSYINSFGETVVAGNAAAMNVECFAFVASNAISQATIAFISQNYGAGRYDRLNPVVVRALACGVFAGGGMGILIAAAGPYLLRIFSDSSIVISIGAERMQIICGLYFLCSFMDVLVGAIRGLGYSVMPTLVSLVGICGLRVAWTAVLFRLPIVLTVEMIYWSYPATWIVTIIAHSCCFLWAMRRIRCQIAEESLFSSDML